MQLLKMVGSQVPLGSVGLPGAGVPKPGWSSKSAEGSFCFLVVFFLIPGDSDLLLRQDRLVLLKQHKRKPPSWFWYIA